MEKPPYDLDALREGVICAQGNIDKLLKILTPENREQVMPFVEKEQKRIREFEYWIQRHLEYRKSQEA